MRDASVNITTNGSVTGHKQDRLVGFRVPWTASKSYVPIMSVVMLAHDTGWPHGDQMFTQLVDCSPVGEVTQFEPVGWIYRHENVVFIKRMKEKSSVNEKSITVRI
jgi:hypothetical protein